tara:strand:+ start:115 stop:564 length:450 start_codon:yes stop_codon:yes gene_type:complete
MLMLVVVALVALCYFGGNKCPKVLKDNKEMLLGVLVGLAICSFMGVRLEGVNNTPSEDFVNPDAVACLGASNAKKSAAARRDIFQKAVTSALVDGGCASHLYSRDCDSEEHKNACPTYCSAVEEQAGVVGSAHCPNYIQYDSMHTTVED